MTTYAAGGVQAKPTGTITREAKRDLSTYQYHAMKIDTDGLVDYVDTSSSGTFIGILQNQPTAAGQEAEIATEGMSLLYVDAGTTDIAIGDKLGSTSTYHGIKVTTATSIYFAVALEAATEDGDLIEVKLLGHQYINV